MKKLPVFLLLPFVLTAAWSQSPFSYSKFSLEMDAAAVKSILDSEFKGKCSIDDYGFYVVNVNTDKKLYIRMGDEKIYTIRVVTANASYSQFVNISALIIAKRGEPDTCRPNGFEYRVEWYGKGFAPGWGLVLSDEDPYTLEEILTYEK